MGNVKIFAQAVAMRGVSVCVSSPAFLLGQKLLRPWEGASVEHRLPAVREQTPPLQLGSSVAVWKVSLISSCSQAVKYPFPVNLNNCFFVCWLSSGVVSVRDLLWAIFGS